LSADGVASSAQEIAPTNQASAAATSSGPASRSGRRDQAMRPARAVDQPTRATPNIMVPGSKDRPYVALLIPSPWTHAIQASPTSRQSGQAISPDPPKRTT
jgi:hypothetical protein